MIGHLARPAGILVLTLSGSRFRGMTRFLDGEIFRRFALARELAADAASGPG